MSVSPAAVAQVCVSGTGIRCFSCGEEKDQLWGTMNNDDTRELRCGPCYDDRVFRDSAPGVREAAEARRVLVYSAFLGAFGGDAA